MQASITGFDFLIDTIALSDLTPLGTVLSSPTVEVVLHDADADLRVLDRDFGIHVARVFDTRVAAQVVGEPAIGLAALLLKYCGVTLDKRYQRADWSVRPLPVELVEYAASDTRHLSALRDALGSRLRDMARDSWAEEEFARLPHTRWSPPTDERDGHERLRGYRALPLDRRGVAQALYEWRDETARLADRAPFRVLGNEQIVQLARVAPKDLTALRGIPGVGASLITRHGEDLLRIIRDGLLRAPSVHRKRTDRPIAAADPRTEERMRRLKALRAGRAASLGIDPGVLCPNSTLAAMATLSRSDAGGFDSVGELRRWQREAMGGDAVLRATLG